MDNGRRSRPANMAKKPNSGRRDQLMDIGGVAERLGVSVRYVRRLVAERRIPVWTVEHFYVEVAKVIRRDVLSAT